MRINNPLIKGGEVRIEKKIQTNFIINKYKENLNLDVAKYFHDIKELYLIRCLTSGLRFYSPASTAGDNLFYYSLQKFKWYYMPWKWEHDKTLDFVKNGMKILEVGSGEGSFLKQLKKVKKIQCKGLELNELSAFEGQKNKVDIVIESIQDHARVNDNHYDLVCSFQVLEHISDVDSFLKAQISCLKKNGLLIVSVPNNNSFIKHDPDDVMNMPPHHMVLWDKVSLSSLPSIYPIQLEGIFYEDLQEYHLNWYTNIVGKKMIWPFSKMYFGFKLNRLLSFMIKTFKIRITGHTILAVFRKN